MTFNPAVAIIEISFFLSEMERVMSTKTSLYEKHVQLGAKVVDFHGWEMPIQYSGIIEEHNAVRSKAGLFDLSHMGEIEVSGPQSYEFLNFLLCNNLDRLEYDGRIIYTGMLNEKGGFIDDLLVYRKQRDSFLLVVNASNREEDFSWMQKQAPPFDVRLNDISMKTGLVAVQGPASASIMADILDYPFENLYYYHFIETAFKRIPVIISRTGYTGEDGFELYADWDKLGIIWDALYSAGQKYGLLPIGLGARDTLRLEARYPLHGNDISPDVTPLEAGLGWIVDLNKPDFIGKKVLSSQKKNGVAKKLIGFTMAERGIPRHGYTIFSGDSAVGEVTSGTMSPSLSTGIGMGYVSSCVLEKNENLTVDIHRSRRCLTLHKGPFVSSNIYRKTVKERI
ncbi:MAG: glycine cleavage system aminomethyltransferase GcvT [Candidatus Auribacter fodinae]|uniref:Aminomethyltransferase n=1 Tax=Candidatus Auribacter fodinae TaxID=2093366 RepID=A0A3A4R560_9BACT|nr:MAG: glycine cleavage system aminomethyltransferase GcvT [Candidatus Auribacter fodinae]